MRRARTVSFPTPQRQVAVRENSRIEIIPLPSVIPHLDELAPNSKISVTCSPAHGLQASMDFVRRLRGLGHDAIPHIAARQLTSAGELQDIVHECDALGVSEYFLVGGDANPPSGEFASSLEVAETVLSTSLRVTRIGFAAYPEGHPSIDDATLARALTAKQQLLASSVVQGYVSTQMSFDAKAIARWVIAAREQGIMLPIRFGVPGHVERAKLARISARLGVVNSLKFLKKNTASILRLMATPEYEPTTLINDVFTRTGALIDGLHIFSFNNIGPTDQWFAHNFPPPEAAGPYPVASRRHRAQPSTAHREN